MNTEHIQFEKLGNNEETKENDSIFDFFHTKEIEAFLEKNLNKPFEVSFNIF